jgi:hypothetical protein
VESGMDMGNIMWIVATMFRAHEESRIKGERVRQAWQNKRKNALCRPLTKIAPYWLRLNGQVFEVIPSRAAIISEIFRLALRGHGRLSIACLLNKRGEPGWSSEKRNPTGIWRPSYIEKILTNPAVTGTFQPHRKVDGKRIPEGEPIKGYFPRIISDDDFYAVGHRLVQRRRKGGRGVDRAHNLFSGLVSCYCCGGSLHYANKGRPEWRYLTCEGRALKHGTCKAASVNYHAFERAILGHIGHLDWESILGGRNVVEFDTTSALKGRLREVGSRISNLVDAMADGLIASTRFREKLTELEEEKAELAAKIKFEESARKGRTSERRLAQDASAAVQQFEAVQLSQEQRMTLKTSIAQLISRIFVKKTDTGELWAIIVFPARNAILLRHSPTGESIDWVGQIQPDNNENGCLLEGIEDESVSIVFGANELRSFESLKKKISK